MSVLANGGWVFFALAGLAVCAFAVLTMMDARGPSHGYPVPPPRQSPTAAELFRMFAAAERDQPRWLCSSCWSAVTERATECYSCGAELQEVG